MSQRATEDRPLGFCTVCIRVRWLDRVTGVDRLNNPSGICTQCARESQQITINLAMCDHAIMDLRHWREDGTCKCDDPDEDLMVDWGYLWDGYEERWVVPSDDDDEEDDDED